MRYILYFLVYSCLVLGLFVTFLYLMTVVDPGLLQLREKAARMMKINAKGKRCVTIRLRKQCKTDCPHLRDLLNVMRSAMGKGQTLLVVACVITIILFGTLCHLMTNVNPPPLRMNDTNDEPIKPEQTLDEFLSVTLGPERTGNDTNSSQLLTSQSSLRKHAAGFQQYYESQNVTSLLKSAQKVMPPISPPKAKPPIMNMTDGSPKNRALNKIGKVGAKSTTLNDTLSVIKRSVNDVKQIGSDLNSIVLKIIDDSGQFNIEIKIGLNDGFLKKKNETREDKIQSTNKSKYSIFLKLQDIDQFKKTKLAKTTIISVMPNDFVTVDEYDDNLKAKNKIKNNTIQANIVDFNNSAKYNITDNKATVMPIYRDVFKPIVIFYNQTKSIYHSGTKTKNNEKRDLLEKPNDANDGCKTNHNSYNTACNTAYSLTTQIEKSNNTAYNLTTQIEKSNNTAYNLTIQTEKSNNTAYDLIIQTEKRDMKTKNGDLLVKPNDASDGFQTNVNSSKAKNNIPYNLTTQSEKGDNKKEKGDLLDKPNGASDETKRNETNLNCSNTENNTAYNLTIQTEKGDIKTEKGDLFEKSNDASDGRQTDLNNSSTVNNTANNSTTQMEKGDIRTENGDLLEPPNIASDETKRNETNLNSCNTENNTAYNLTIQTEKGDIKTEKGDLFEKSNDASDGRQRDLNNSSTVNNTANNSTTQMEKGDIRTENGDLLETPNIASDETKRNETNLNSSNKENNTAYNLTIQTEKGDIKTEKGDLFEKSNDASDGCQTDLNNSNTVNNKAYNLTIKTEKGDKKTEKEDLLEKLNDASDRCQMNLKNSNAANNTTNNLIIQVDKWDKKTEKEDVFEKTNEASNGRQTNLNGFKTENITGYNITVHTEKANNTAYNFKNTDRKTTLQCSVLTTRNENTTVEADNSTETLDEIPPMAVEVNSTIP